MKKKAILISIVVLAALAVFIFITAVCFWILPGTVVRIELGSYDHTDTEGIVLTEEETQKVLALYNTSWFGGEINAEPCCDAYWFSVTFEDGSTMKVSEGVKNKMIAHPQNGKSYYVTNGALITYLMDLLEKYDLPTE